MIILLFFIGCTGQAWFTAESLWKGTTQGCEYQGDMPHWTPSLETDYHIIYVNEEKKSFQVPNVGTVPILTAAFISYWYLCRDSLCRFSSGLPSPPSALAFSPSSHCFCFVHNCHWSLSSVCLLLKDSSLVALRSHCVPWWPLVPRPQVCISSLNCFHYKGTANR